MEYKCFTNIALDDKRHLNPFISHILFDFKRFEMLINSLILFKTLRSKNYSHLRYVHTTSSQLTKYDEVPLYLLRQCCPMMGTWKSLLGKRVSQSEVVNITFLEFCLPGHRAVISGVRKRSMSARSDVPNKRPIKNTTQNTITRRFWESNSVSTARKFYRWDIL